MGEGYVFHCTPCGRPHAGECPPRAQPRGPGLSEGDLRAVLADIKKELSKISNYAPVATPAFWPLVGSRWVVETLQSSGWRQTSYLAYEVASTDPLKGEVVVTRVGGGGSAYHRYPRECWDTSGGVASSGMTVRWVQAP